MSVTRRRATQTFRWKGWPKSIGGVLGNKRSGKSACGDSVTSRCGGAQVGSVPAMRTRKGGSDATPIHAFAGACLLTAALLLPHGHLRPVLSGMGLAGLIQWTWRSRQKGKEPDDE